MYIVELISELVVILIEYMGIQRTLSYTQILRNT